MIAGAHFSAFKEVSEKPGCKNDDVTAKIQQHPRREHWGGNIEIDVEGKNGSQPTRPKTRNVRARNSHVAITRRHTLPAHQKRPIIRADVAFSMQYLGKSDRDGHDEILPVF